MIDAADATARLELTDSVRARLGQLVFDGVQWILFAAAHTDDHLPQRTPSGSSRDNRSC